MDLHVDTDQLRSGAAILKAQASALRAPFFAVTVDDNAFGPSTLGLEVATLLRQRTSQANDARLTLASVAESLGDQIALTAAQFESAESQAR